MHFLSRSCIYKEAFALVLLAAAVSCFALSGCKPRPGILSRSLAVSGPIVVGRHLAYMDATRERMTLLDPQSRQTRHIDLGRKPGFMLPTPDHSRLLAICKGWIATNSDEQDEEPSLHIIDPVSGEVVVHDIGSPFDEVAISDDNRYAVAYFSTNAEPSETEVFRNPNAVAILDMETGQLDHKNVRSFGDVPRGVVFSPAAMAPLNADGTPGSPRTLAMVFASGYVTLLDVSHPERREITVRLALPGMTGDLIPAEVVFAPRAGAAYLRVTGTSDIYVLSLATRPDAEPQENDFVVSVNTLAAGSVPSDIALFNDDDRQKVLVANQYSADLTVIDALTAEFVTVDVGDPVDRILTYPEDDPQVAIVFSQANPRRTIHFLDLAGVEANRGRNLTTLNGAEPVLAVEVVPNRAQALVTHNHDRSVMSVLDVTEQTLAPFTGHAAVADYAMTTNGHILGGFASGQSQLGVVNLLELSSRTVMLDHPPREVLTLAVPPTDTDPSGQMVVVDHFETFGMVTVLPNPLTDNADTTYVLSGFLMEGLLDERYED